MNEERMDVVLEEAWEDEIPAEIRNYGDPAETQRSGFGGERTSTEMNEASPWGGDERYGGCEDESAGHEETGVNKENTGGVGAADNEKAQQEKMPAVEPELLKVPKGEAGKEHPLLTRARENARKQEMERFLNTYPEVKAADIPRGVWEQVAKGVPLVSAYAMYENQQLKMQLAAERQDKLNRQRTPGALGSHSGNELDELDRMWNEDD